MAAFAHCLALAQNNRIFTFPVSECPRGFYACIDCVQGSVYCLWTASLLMNMPRS